MGKILGDLNPQLLWNHFEEICSHPHPSRKEDQLAEYVMSIGKRNNLETLRDDFGNVLIRKPATKGYEKLPVVVLQGHLDMVPEKNADVQHDFEKDPIKPFIEEGWVRAKGTTLGSDNGIGVAAALAVIEAKDIEHGPLEFLFTLDEETGLNGASSLKPGFLKAEILLNLDSEEDGALYIGCAGGKNTYPKFRYLPEELPDDSVSYQIKVTGLRGGHSGLNISDGRGNALKIMARLLWELMRKHFVRLSKIEGGSKHNAIPRECFADIILPKKSESECLELIKTYNETLKKELATNEPGLKVEAVSIPLPQVVIDLRTGAKIINALYGVPNGVITMSPDIPGLVETSSNLAVITTDNESVNAITSQRSSVESEKDDIASQVEAVFYLADAEVTHGDGYPGWKPNVKSNILKVVKSTYKDMFGSEPEVKAIHAGLECGIINERYPQMDMISFGPTIVGAHSPDEKVKIDTVDKFWELLKNVLKNIPAK